MVVLPTLRLPTSLTADQILVLIRTTIRLVAHRSPLVAPRHMAGTPQYTSNRAITHTLLPLPRIPLLPRVHMHTGPRRNPSWAPTHTPQRVHSPSTVNPHHRDISLPVQYHTALLWNRKVIPPVLLHSSSVPNQCLTLRLS